MKSGKDKAWIIYVLYDPHKDIRPDNARYVGYAKSMTARMTSHLRDARYEKCHKANWIRSLVRGGVKPYAIQVDEGLGEWRSAEQHWIAKYKMMGTNLTNATIGGDGVLGLVHTEESKAKISAACKVACNTPEFKAQCSVRARAMSPETRARIADKQRGKKKGPYPNRGRKLPDEIVAARRGKKRSAETRAKMSEANRRRWSDPEARRKQSEKLKGRIVSDTTRRKISESIKGKLVGKKRPPRSAKWRAALSAAHKARWSRIKNRRQKDAGGGQLSLF